MKIRLAPGEKYKICHFDPTDLLTQRFDHQFKSRWKGLSNASTEAEEMGGAVVLRCGVWVGGCCGARDRRTPPQIHCTATLQLANLQLSFCQQYVYASY